MALTQQLKYFLAIPEPELICNVLDGKTHPYISLDHKKALAGISTDEIYRAYVLAKGISNILWKSALEVVADKPADTKTPGRLLDQYAEWTCLKNLLRSKLPPVCVWLPQNEIEEDAMPDTYNPEND